MAAAEQVNTNDELTILTLDNTIGERLIKELSNKGYLKKGKEDKALAIINGLSVNKNKIPKQFAGKKPNRDANLIKKLMPFTGVCIQGKCQALNNNHGLFNQCDKAPQNNSKYCKACQSPNGTSGLTRIQSCGTVQDRIMQYEESGDINKYKTPTNEAKKRNGDMVVKNGVWARTVGKVLEELNKKRETPIEREQIEDLAEEMGLDIPEACWEVPVSKRGRKAGSKNNSKNNTPVTSDEEPEPEPEVQVEAEEKQTEDDVQEDDPIPSDSDDDSDDDDE